jgi:hypothetical protein
MAAKGPATPAKNITAALKKTRGRITAAAILLAARHSKLKTLMQEEHWELIRSFYEEMTDLAESGLE